MKRKTMNHENTKTQREEESAARVSPLARFFFLKTTFGILLTFLLAVSGVLGYRSMVKEALPDLEIPQATVQTERPGADADTIEKEITNEIERKIKSLKGLKRVRSASFNSFSVIAVEFLADANLDESMQLLREKVRDAEPRLPKDAKKPKIEQVAVDDTPILTIALFGDLDEALLGRAAKDLKEVLERIPGVNRVELGGKRDEAVLVQLKLDRIYALGISPTSVKQRLETANLDMPLDRFEHEEVGSTVRLFGRFRDLQDIRNVPVVRRGDSRVVRLGEIASVRRDLEKENARVSASIRGEPYRRAIDVSVIKIPGMDTLRIIERSKAAVEEFKRSSRWPFSMQYEVTSDQSHQIRENLNAVFSNGWQAMLAVFVVLFIMLSWREALVAGLSIPLTFLGAIAVVHALGYTMNEVVIIGMVLSLGLLVDVFILMMEGLHDGMFVEGLPFNEAALKTVKTYAMPAFAGQMTTILAMLPLMFIEGVDGKFIRIIPVTAIACLVLSFAIALVVDIPLARLLMERGGGRFTETRIDKISEYLSERLRTFTLEHTVKTKRTALAWTLGTLALFGLSVAGFGLLPQKLYPEKYGRKLGILVEMPPGSTLNRSQKVADEFGDLLGSRPYFQSVMKFVGRKSPLSQNSIGEALSPTTDTNLIGFSCFFRPQAELDQPIGSYLESLRAELSRVVVDHPGVSLVLTPETGGTNTEDPIQIQFVGDDMDTLREISGQVQAGLRAVPGTYDVRDNLGPTRLDVQMVPRREAIDFYGMPMDDLAYQLRFAMTSDPVGTYPVLGTEKDLKIRLGVAWPSRGGSPGGPTTMEETAMFRVFDPKGETVPVLAVVKAVVGAAPVSITHKGGRRAVTVMAKTSDRTVGEILEEFTPILEGMKKSWPEGYRYSIAGEAESSAETFGSATTMFVVAIVLVFSLLVLQFSSFTQPFIILLSVLFAMIGTFGGFFLAWIPFSFPAMVGMISLVGIVVNDSIVMIDTMNHHRGDGMSVREAASRGAADRLRPIVSTSLTTVAGLIPLALSNPMWMPLCNAIIFGLVVATFISQMVVPCVYVLFTRDGDASPAGTGGL